MNCIQYTVCDTLGFSIDNTAAAQYHGSRCTLDFIVITGSSQTCNNPILNARYCGSYLGFDAAITANQNTPICGESFC